MANWVCIDIRSASASTAWRKASLTKWARARRVWIRVIDQDTGRVVEQRTVGYIDARNIGPRSAAHRILEEARRIYQNEIDAGRAAALPADLAAILLQPYGGRNLREYLRQRQKPARQRRKVGVRTATTA